MELLNATRMQAAYTTGLRPDARELLVVVVKGTFLIPPDGGEARLAEEQVPLVEADVFTGEPGHSAPVYECDYAPVKPLCDVILNGSAYAPGGVPTGRVRVALEVERAKKAFDVVGNRFWQGDVFGASITEPKPFTAMPFSYDTAFGGVNDFAQDPEKRQAYWQNPIGRGFHPNTPPRLLDGKPLPNTEEPGRPVTSTTRSYKPLSFGPIGRGWQPRLRYAGTYDQNWVDSVFPFLPADFDERYYQCAPQDLQTEYLIGGERVVLQNLTPAGYLRFVLPKMDVPVCFFQKNYEQKEMQAVCDTLFIEPDAGRFTLTWRASLPLRRNLFEIAQVVAGRMPRGWYRARELGKTYYGSLKQMVDVRREERSA